MKVTRYDGKVYERLVHCEIIMKRSRDVWGGEPMEGKSRQATAPERLESLRGCGMHDACKAFRGCEIQYVLSSSERSRISRSQISVQGLIQIDPISYWYT
eukprot:scaffold1187_cov258-Pinguiococcus_pyrenoidosus.AAC.17